MFFKSHRDGNGAWSIELDRKDFEVAVWDGVRGWLTEL